MKGVEFSDLERLKQKDLLWVIGEIDTIDGTGFVRRRSGWWRAANSGSRNYFGLFFISIGGKSLILIFQEVVKVPLEGGMGVEMELGQVGGTDSHFYNLVSGVFEANPGLVARSEVRDAKTGEVKKKPRPKIMDVPLGIEVTLYWLTTVMSIL